MNIIIYRNNIYLIINMETIEHRIDELFFKLGVWMSILSYYGFYREWGRFMMQTSKETRKAWIEHDQVFGLHIRKRRKRMVFERGFDELISEYLLENDRYKNYELDLLLNQSGSNVLGYKISWKVNKILFIDLDMKWYIKTSI